jgi:hypothetical protein
LVQPYSARYELALRPLYVPLYWMTLAPPTQLPMLDHDELYNR